MLSQLIYVSVRSSNCDEIEMQKILSSCIKNNKNVDITGVLLYSDTKFIQYLEGEYKEIMGLYDKIKLDPRHKNVIMVSGGPLATRCFPSWQMGSKKIADNEVNFKTNMSDDEKKEFAALISGEKTSSKAIDLIKKFF